MVGGEIRCLTVGDTEFFGQNLCKLLLRYCRVRLKKYSEETFSFCINRHTSSWLCELIVKRAIVYLLFSQVRSVESSSFGSAIWRNSQFVSCSLLCLTAVAWHVLFLPGFLFFRPALRPRRKALPEADVSTYVRACVTVENSVPHLHT